MRVVIGFDPSGNPYVISAPKKIEVVFKKPRSHPKAKPLKKRIRTLWYRLMTLC